MQKAIRTVVGAIVAALLLAPTATSLRAQDVDVVVDNDDDDIDGSGGLVIKAGFSYGDVSNSGVFPGGARTRQGLAVGFGMVGRNPVTFGIEALYAQRGIIGDPGSSRELDYIDIPVYLKLAAANMAVEPFFIIGPQVSYELKCDSNGGSCPSGRDRWSYAGAIGAGVRLPMVGGLSIEGRYVYGLSDLRLGTVTDTENYQTRSFMLLLGIGF